MNGDETKPAPLEVAFLATAWCAPFWACVTVAVIALLHH